MAVTTWKRTIFGLSLALLFSLFSLAFYPKPVEIILLATIGLGSLLLLVFAYVKWESNQKPDANDRVKILKIVFLGIILIYLIYILLVIRTSLWEGRLVFDILHTKRGIAYIIISFLAALALTLYCLFYYLKHRRWPTYEDHDFNNKKTHIEKRANNRKRTDN